ncbi:MAG: DUF1266 domain-containing protein [Treponema sp.]|nr:DUF1266 domain-containing protein [Treponema sp.]
MQKSNNSKNTKQILASIIVLFALGVTSCKTTQNVAGQTDSTSNTTTAETSPRILPEPIIFSRTQDGYTVLTLTLPEKTIYLHIYRKTADTSYEQIFGIGSNHYEGEYMPCTGSVQFTDYFAQKDTVYSYYYSFGYKEAGHTVHSRGSYEAGYRAENGWGELRIYGGNLHYDEETAILHIDSYPEYSPRNVTIATARAETVKPEIYHIDPAPAAIKGALHLYLTDGNLRKELPLEKGNDIDLKPFAKHNPAFRNTPLYLQWKMELTVENQMGVHLSRMVTDVHYQPDVPKITYELTSKVSKEFKPIRKRIDAIYEHAATPVCALDKTTVQEQFAWVVGLSGVQSYQNGENSDMLAVTDDSREIPEYIDLLKNSSWAIENSSGLLQQLRWLLSGGGARASYSVIQKAIKEHPKASEYSIHWKLIRADNANASITFEDIRHVQALADYTENRSILAFDYGRAVWLIRVGYTIGYLNQDEAYYLLSTISQSILGVYSSWEDFGTNYCIGWLYVLGMESGQNALTNLEIILNDDAWLKNRKWINKAHIIIPFTFNF